MKNTHYHSSKSLLSLLAICLVSLLGQSAQAVINPETDFTLFLGAYEDVLLSEGTTFAHQCGDQYQELAAHTSPYIKITNTSTNPIDQLMVTIGDTDYHFNNSAGLGGEFAQPGDNSDMVSFDSLVSALDGSPAASEADQDKLTVNFVGGLQPGQMATINFSLAPDSGFSPYVDYRHVMMQAQQAKFTVVGMLGQEDEMSVDVFPNSPADMTPIGFSRPPGQPAATQMFEITVPEPTSLCIAMLGFVVLAAGNRRLL